MLNKGKFLSFLTLTITAANEVKPRKFIKVSVIVYDVGVRSCAKMLIGVEIWPWYFELWALSKAAILMASLRAGAELFVTVNAFHKIEAYGRPPFP